MLSGVDFVAKNVVKTPNPNRYSPLVLMCRVILIVFLFWYLYDDDIHMNLLFCFVAPILGVYMLCVESMPKEEKDKRKHSKKRETITAYTS